VYANKWLRVTTEVVEGKVVNKIFWLWKKGWCYILVLVGDELFPLFFLSYFLCTSFSSSGSSAVTFDIRVVWRFWLMVDKGI
jgi:hypothetical protein